MENKQIELNRKLKKELNALRKKYGIQREINNELIKKYSSMLELGKQKLDFLRAYNDDNFDVIEHERLKARYAKLYNKYVKLRKDIQSINMTTEDDD